MCVQIVIAAEAFGEIGESRVGDHREVRAGVAGVDLGASLAFEE